MAAISTPEPITARGSVLRGSLTSWLIAETSSRHVNANAICDQKLTVSQLQCGSMFAQVNCVADPWRKHSIAARHVKILCLDRKSTRLNSSHDQISYAVFCLKKKKKRTTTPRSASPSTRSVSY